MLQYQTNFTSLISKVNPLKKTALLQIKVKYVILINLTYESKRKQLKASSLCNFNIGVTPITNYN